MNYPATNLFNIPSKHNSGILTDEEANGMTWKDIIQNCIDTDRRPNNVILGKEHSWRTCAFGVAISKRLPEWSSPDIPDHHRQEILTQTIIGIVRLGELLKVSIATSHYVDALRITNRIESIANNISDDKLDIIRKMLTGPTAL